ERPDKFRVSDKDGGFALVRKTDLIEAHRSALAGTSYEEISPLQLHGKIITFEYCDIVKQVERKVTATLGETLKTHKAPGEVAFGILRARRHHSFRGLGAWLSKTIRDQFKHKPYILSSTEQLIEVLNKTTFAANVAFLRFDVRDFFMSGDPSTLVSGATR
ncbi:unnamed protein product, partial [Prorocentrum cordatum]